MTSSDPLLFERLREHANKTPGMNERSSQLGSYLKEMTVRYSRLFCGDMQVLGKLKAIVSQLNDPELEKTLKKLRMAKNIVAFGSTLEKLC